MSGRIAQFNFASNTSSDSNFKNTVLLLSGNGTNGAQNNTFLDSSPNNHTITRNGNVTQGTFSPFSVREGRWSNYFDGTGDYLQCAADAAFDITATDFTIEAWVYATSQNTVRTIATQRSGASIGYGFRINSDNKLNFYYTQKTPGLTSVNDVPINQWVHVAATRSGTTVKVFINGVEEDSQNPPNGTASAAYVFRVGINHSATEPFAGYISNLRLIKGTALYTSSFTPPTAPLTAITNTSLLTCQSNRFVDNSTNAFAITRNGDVRVTSFSPFATSTEIDRSFGSGYFDGSGDYLTAPSSSALEPGSGDFTIEMWFYPLALPGVAQFLVSRANSSSYANFSVSYRSTGSIEAYMSLSNPSSVPAIINAGSCPVGTWSHIVFTKSNLTYTLYINGTQVGTVTAGSHPPTGLSTITEISSNTYPINGYLAGVKIIKGTAVAPSGIPTTPPVDSSGTSLLLNFTNAGIFDNTGKNNLDTVGNAQIDTTTKKFGTGSLEFDGSGDWLIMPNSPDLQFGSGDFTIEFWWYPNTTSDQNLVSKWNSSTEWILQWRNAGYFRWAANGSVIRDANHSLATSTWIHVAVSCSATSLRIFVNGTQIGTTATQSAITVTTEPLVIGAGQLSSTPLPVNGFIDDLRITKGVARYTANFTPPIRQHLRK